MVFSFINRLFHIVLENERCIDRNGTIYILIKLHFFFCCYESNFTFCRNNWSDQLHLINLTPSILFSHVYKDTPKGRVLIFLFKGVKEVRPPTRTFDSVALITCMDGGVLFISPSHFRFPLKQKQT